jgi:alpha-galactosidase
VNTRIPTLHDERIQVHIRTEPYAGRPQPRTVGGQPGERLRKTDERALEEPIGPLRQITYEDDVTGLRAVHHTQFVEGLPIARYWVTLANTSSCSFTVDSLYAAYLGRIPWEDDRQQFRLHLPHNKCHTEGQWRVNPLSALGLVKAHNDMYVRTVARSSSCREYLPMAMLEDILHGWTLVWQIEYSGSWMWELGQMGDDREFLDLAVGGLNEEHLHWYRTLDPGDEFASMPVAFGCVEGDAEDALAAMVGYRRAACKIPHPVDDRCPVIFNDYMNCLWGFANREKSLPLIPRAADAGCEVYMVDGGWYGKEGWQEIGDWHEDRAKYPNGLNEIFDGVRDRGMIPGLWMEIESAANNVPLARKPDDWFLSVGGVRNLFNGCYHLDFRHPDVRAFADGAFDRVIEQYGLGYMKLDYNRTPILGTDRDSDSTEDGALEHIRAYYQWFDAVRARHPHVIFENCSSGGMRNDYGILSRTQLCSSSDQTNYKWYPSVAVGCAAAILPEQLAVWSYPMEDGDREEAIFNMVSSLLMRIHLSGQIWLISDEQFAAVCEAVTIYKETIRADIPHAMPFYPLGRPTIEQTDTFNAFGQYRSNAGRAWLAIWRLDAEESRIQVPLPAGVRDLSVAKQAYPAEAGGAIENSDGTLTVELPQRYSARVFELGAG